jgi:glycosyltransferase involved in cell wall biosynthesis
MRESAGKGVLMLLGNNPFPLDPRVKRAALALAAAGYRVSVIAPRAPGEPTRETVEGVHVYRFREAGGAQGFAGYVLEYAVCTLAALGLSVRVLRERGFDVVHAHNPPDTFVIVGAAYKLLGKRFVFDQHDLAPEMYDARFGGKGNRVVRSMLGLFERASLRLADGVIATNDSYKAVQTERGKVPPERIAVVRNAPGFDDPAPVEPDPALRARASALIGYLGHMGYQDGVDHLLRAVRHLVVDLGRIDTLCVLIGRGDAHEDLRRLAGELRIEKHVWFPGFLPVADVFRYLSTVDVCVVPDPSNAFNDRSTMTKVMDYMAFARPIVGFDLPETRVTAGEAAAYAPPNDDAALARQIAALLDDPVRRGEMGAYGRRRVLTDLAWDRNRPHLLELYRWLLRDGPGSAAAGGRHGNRRSRRSAGAR